VEGPPVNCHLEIVVRTRDRATVKIGQSTRTKLSGTAVIEGVGFWDYPHALGHDAGIEIHPRDSV
jgi:hypothetical protein